MASRNQRFTSDGSDIVTSKNVNLSLIVLQAVEMPEATHQDLIKGLEKEINVNKNLKSDWNDADKYWFQTKKESVDWTNNKEYHLALRVFSMNGFYPEFNEACRNLKSIKEAELFKFRYYFNLLLRAIRTIKGEPQAISTTTYLYRGCKIKFPSLVLNEHFLFKQFTSTSLYKANAEHFMGPNGTLFIIKGINHGIIGKQRVIGLKNHSAYPFENEVLINPFQVFKVTKIEEGCSWLESFFYDSLTTVYLEATD